MYLAKLSIKMNSLKYQKAIWIEFLDQLNVSCDLIYEPVLIAEMHAALNSFISDEIKKKLPVRKMSKSGWNLIVGVVQST